MNVSFLRDEPLNTVIVSTGDERPLYEVWTPWKIFNRTTIVRRLKAGMAFGAGEIIAQIHWRSLGSPTITLYGSTMRIKDWLRKDRMFSSCVTGVPQLCHSTHSSRIQIQDTYCKRWKVI